MNRIEICFEMEAREQEVVRLERKIALCDLWIEDALYEIEKITNWKRTHWGDVRVESLEDDLIVAQRNKRHYKLELSNIS